MKTPFNRIIIALFLAFSLQINVIAESGKYEIDSTDDAVSYVCSHIDQANDKITRGDCITAVMKVLGMNEMSAELYKNSNANRPVYRDYHKDYKNKGYIIVAVRGGIVKGIEGGVEPRVAPDEKVTIKECLLFMLRCVCNDSSINWNSDIEAVAEKEGLLMYEEIDINEVLDINQFYTLLERLLTRQRYLYWKETDEARYPGLGCIERDQTNSIKYIDLFLQNT